MKRIRRGFTLVEVALFLAITAAVFVGIAVGTQNSIFQQRYNDSVQNFVEFLRSTYSQVTNVQNNGDGRSNRAIYGKLAVFGEDAEGNNAITTYNVIGEVGGFDAGGVLSSLSALGASVFDENGEPVGWVENYKPRWASQIQTTEGWGSVKPNSYELFVGALLIVRHPSSGTVHTYVFDPEEGAWGNVDDLDKKFDASLLNDFLKNNFFKSEDVIFCVNPNGADRSNLRRGVKIVKGASNASGIEVLSDGEGCDT